ncbi:hypothetical protein PENTCL1PPCAC_27628, partial [Pristionchus entomophagus]
LSLVLIGSSLFVFGACQESDSMPIGLSAVDGESLYIQLRFPPLKNVSEQARKEFANILLNQTLTKEQLETAIKAWGTKNGILDAVNAEMNKLEQTTKDQRANVTRALGELPALITKLNAIEDNKSLTMTQTVEQTVALFQSIKTPYLGAFLQAAATPEYSEGEEPVFSVNAAAKKRR